MSWSTDPVAAYNELYYEGVEAADAALRQQAATGIAKLLAKPGAIPGAGRDGAVAELLQWLRDEDAKVRLACVEALGHAVHPTEQICIGLQEALSDADGEVRDAAEEALSGASVSDAGTDASKANTSRDWLLRDKWLGFYDGSFAPHLQTAAGVAASIDGLPWRSGAPSSKLVEFIAAGKLSPDAAAIELGCGTGENLACLASACRHAVGVDIAPAAVCATDLTLAAAGLSARTLVADVLALPDDLQGAFDFVFDSQTYHCVRKVDEDGAAAAVVSLLRPNGLLLLLTGNADEPEERGPERLTRQDLEKAFVTRGLSCEACEAFRFDWTDAYRRQPQAEPPLGWCSVWRRSAE